MANEVAIFLDGWQADRQKMKAETPDLQRSFETFHHAIMKEGVLSARKRS